jgi:hypothetical protein
MEYDQKGHPDLGKNLNQRSEITSQKPPLFSLFPDENKMAKTRKSAKQGGHQKRSKRVSLAYLDKLISEATVDCYNESEQITGIFTMLEESLAVPFATTLLGLEVTVERIAMNDANDIVAVCRRGHERQRVPILDLPLPEPRPRGAEWIDAFRRWAKRG